MSVILSYESGLVFNLPGTHLPFVAHKDLPIEGLFCSQELELGSSTRRRKWTRSFFLDSSSAELFPAPCLCSSAHTKIGHSTMGKSLHICEGFLLTNAPGVDWTTACSAQTHSKETKEMGQL